MLKKPSAIIIGPAHPLRGGLASFNERLARQWQHHGYDTTIVTFSLQYPNFLFPGTTQYSSEPAPTDINIEVDINAVNPFNWLVVGNKLRRLKADVIIVRYWLPFMGPCLGTILRLAKWNKHTKVICIADNIIPHERRIGDSLFTHYFVGPVDGFITMSQTVFNQLPRFSKKPAQQVVHPLYDNFGAAVDKQTARKRLGINENEKLILFFGFIRHYKGLDILFDAMNQINLKNSGVRLLVAGEYYEDKQKYIKQMYDLNIAHLLHMRTDFIPDSEVRYYLSAADFVIQPYRNATQSGVTPLAYHFEKPMLVTNVGGLPDMVPDGKVGVVVEPNAPEIANGIMRLYGMGEQHFLPHLRAEKTKYSWKVLVNTIETLAALPQTNPTTEIPYLP